MSSWNDVAIAITFLILGIAVGPAAHAVLKAIGAVFSEATKAYLADHGQS
jgi:hypothetical protein